mmetsp:Transcript_74172/g.197801  ORF Transcript_74172/g.197801 Transcript_74172/m.197801 type:complete len:258 (-) Transcript_74172:1854-2627(-)
MRLGPGKRGALETLDPGGLPGGPNGGQQPGVMQELPSRKLLRGRPRCGAALPRRSLPLPAQVLLSDPLPRGLDCPRRQRGLELFGVRPRLPGRLVAAGQLLLGHGAEPRLRGGGRRCADRALARGQAGLAHVGQPIRIPRGRERGGEEAAERRGGGKGEAAPAEAGRILPELRDPACGLVGALEGGAVFFGPMRGRVRSIDWRGVRREDARTLGRAVSAQVEDASEGAGRSCGADVGASGRGRRSRLRRLGRVPCRT